MDLATEIALVGLAVAVCGLIIALIPLWLHVGFLEAEKQ
jgi:hypothetical protein